MKKPLFTRCVTFLLILSLTLGQGSLAFAATSLRQTPTSASMSMAGMHMDIVKAGHDSKECCPSSDKGKVEKNMACDACCTATTAALPFQSHILLQYATVQSYELVDTAAVSKPLPPEPPPPKA